MPKGAREKLLSLRLAARTAKERNYTMGRTPWDDSDTCKRLIRRVEAKGIRTQVRDGDLELI